MIAPQREGVCTEAVVLPRPSMANGASNRLVPSHPAPGRTIASGWRIVTLWHPMRWSFPKPVCSMVAIQDALTPTPLVLREGLPLAPSEAAARFAHPPASSPKKQEIIGNESKRWEQGSPQMSKCQSDAGTELGATKSQQDRCGRQGWEWDARSVAGKKRYLSQQSSSAIAWKPPPRCSPPGKSQSGHKHTLFLFFHSQDLSQSMETPQQRGQA